MAKITVHILNFHGFYSHLEIVLENNSVTPSQYYRINRWSEPKVGWDIAGKGSLAEKKIQQASSIYSFDIEAEPFEIVNVWEDYYDETFGHSSLLGDNCALAVQKFLTHFANIPEPNESNTSWNHLAGGIMWPSFFPTITTLPGRIMDNAKFYTKLPVYTAIDELPDNHKNEFLKEIIFYLKSPQQHSPNLNTQTALTRLNSLMEFYDCLSKISEHAENLAERGCETEAACANTLCDQLEEYAREYISSNEDDAFNIFKSRCNIHIQPVKPILEVHRGYKQLLGNLALAIVGAGIFYLLATCIHKAITGKFLFFNQTHSMNDVSNIEKSIAICGERNKAINQRPLSV